MTILLCTLVSAVIAPAIIVSALLPESAWARLQRDREPPDAFACKLRPSSTTRSTTRWPRRRARAMWVHDVLIVRAARLKTGRLWPRICALPVRLPEDTIREARSGEVSGLGLHPMVITLRLDDDRLIEVAASENDRSLLVGPFCAAAIPGLRTGRVERLPWKPTGPSRRSDPKKRD